jgi:hypothetical protein
VTLQIEIGYRKAKTCRFGSAKWFWPSNFAEFLRLVKGTAKSFNVKKIHEKGVFELVHLL